MNKVQLRRNHLTEYSRRVQIAAGRGMFGQAFRVQAVRAINGFRAGALHVDAGMHTGTMLSALTKNSEALARQLCPWEFPDTSLQVFMAGRSLRLEAGWPDSLAEKHVRLSQINRRPERDGRWCVGLDENGKTTIAQLDDYNPSWLFGGQTGSGKTVALRCATLQLGMDTTNEIVLLDGKFGEGLGMLAHLPAVVGPVAVEQEDVTLALGWVCSQMMDRYRTQAQGRLVVIFDEFQEFANNSQVAYLMRRIASQGRAAGVHLIAATQHPLNSVLGDPTTKRNLAGRIALTVTDYKASEVIVGDSMPRADRLTGQGDCYCQKRRVQGAYVDERDVEAISHERDYLFDEWADADINIADLGDGLPNETKREPQYTPDEVANAVLSAIDGEGRVKFRKRFDRPPGANRARRLLALGREIWDTLSVAPEIARFCEVTQ